MPDLAARIDHTLLKPEASGPQIDALVDEALRFGFASVCVNGYHLPRAVERLNQAQRRPSPTPPSPRGERGSERDPLLRSGRGQGEGSFKITYTREDEAAARALQLRKRMTGPELALWDRLRGKALGGVKFRRQHPIGPYIVDFFAASLGLAIEVDGESHVGAERDEHDRRRDAFLRTHGIEVLRIPNDEALRNIDGVTASIARVIEQSQRRPSPTPPTGGRGSERDPLLRSGRGQGEGSSAHLVRACAVASFPLGAMTPIGRALECTNLAKLGAQEIDIVAFLPHLLAKDSAALAGDLIETVRQVRAVSRTIVVKVILETAALRAQAENDTDFEAMIEAGCEAARRSGCDFVKTSTGFHSAGGATVEAVQLMKKHANGLLVKASGGIRTRDDALRMLDAGADRLGCSSGVAIVTGGAGVGAY
jgi:deoxyribose-phosphate aldolase